MPALLPALLAVALGAEVGVDTGIRGEARYRHVDPAVSPAAERALDLSATPRLRLELRQAQSWAAAEYAPRFSADDVGPDVRYRQMHTGSVRLHLEPDVSWSVEAFGNGSRGRTDLASAYQDLLTRRTISTNTVIDQQELRGGVALRLVPDRRSELQASATYSESGGTNEPSRVDYPVARESEAQAQYLYRITRLDRLGLRLTAAQSRIAAREADAAWASALGTWRHRASPEVEVWGAAGAVGISSRAPEAQGAEERHTRELVRPAGEAGLEWRPPTPKAPETSATASPPGTVTPTALTGFSGELVTSLGASVDRATGQGGQSLDARGTLRWQATRTLALSGRGLAGVTWLGTSRTRSGRLELSGALAIPPRATIDLGVYTYGQGASQAVVADYVEYGVFLGVTLDAPRLAF